MTASPEGEKNLFRFKVALHRDGMGTFEIIQGQAKGLGKVMSFPEIFFYLKGYDFRIRGNAPTNILPAVSFELSPQCAVVVYVAVECHVD